MLNQQTGRKVKSLIIPDVGQQNTQTLLGRVSAGATLWGKKIHLLTPQFYFYIYPGEIKTHVHTKTAAKVHSNIFHNSHKLESTHMSINGHMDKQKWYSHTMKYYSTVKPMKC